MAVSEDLPLTTFQEASTLFMSFSQMILRLTNLSSKLSKEFVANDSNFKTLMPLVDHNQPFIELQLRFNLVTAAYGRVMADRVFIITDDPQVAKAVDVLPRARDLAMSATRHQIQP